MIVPRNFLKKILYNIGSHILPDKTYLRLIYYVHVGKKLNLDNPNTFTEKLQWLKLYDRKPDYSIMVDKVKVKAWVAERIGSEYIIPTIGVWDKAEDVDFNSLPDSFVLKTNHDSGAVILCKDKHDVIYDDIKKMLNKSLRINYYKKGREWPYKKVVRKILAEEYIVDESGYELKDYKIFCFQGKPEFIQVDFDRFASTGHKRNLYTLDWHLLDFEFAFPSNSSIKIKRPDNLDKMLNLASILSQGFPFLRVDFYSINNTIKFGELTFYPESGFGRFTPEFRNIELGKKLILPNKN